MTELPVEVRKHTDPERGNIVIDLGVLVRSRIEISNREISILNEHEIVALINEKVKWGLHEMRSTLDLPLEGEEAVMAKIVKLESPAVELVRKSWERTKQYTENECWKGGVKRMVNHEP